MIDMKGFISDMWLDKWIDSPAMKYLGEQATGQGWTPVINRDSQICLSDTPKVMELVVVDPPILRIYARFHTGVAVLHKDKSLLRKARNSSLEGEVLLHRDMFEDPHNATQEEIDLLKMTHPDLFTFAPLFNRVIRSAMIEATQILTKEGRL